MNLDYRPAEPDDLRFIEGAYLDNTKFSYQSGTTAIEDWDEEERPRWRRILQRPNVRGIVAYKPGETSESDADLYGFIIIEDEYSEHKTGKRFPYVVFLYYKKNFRKKFDIEAGLWRAAGIDPTKPFHYAIKTPSLSRNPLFKKDMYRPLYVKFPPPKSNPESPERTA